MAQASDAVSGQGLGVEAKHRQAIMSLARAQAQGLNSSLPSLASGLRAWHAFATSLLNYPVTASLPPRRDMHVEQFMSLCGCGTTGATYVSFLRWTCAHLHLSMEWDTPRVHQVVKGVIWEWRPASHVLTDSLHWKVVAVADGLQMAGMAEACILFWECLLRVQSEGVALQKGEPSDAMCLPEERHSGVWLDAAGVLQVRLQRRKHRPQGSLLQRQCRCHEVGLAHCPTHRLKAWLEQRAVGEPLWAFGSAEFARLLRRCLMLLGVPEAARYQLKAFREGRATALAASGWPLGDILRAGEWRSAEFYRYIGVDVVDVKQLLLATFAASDAEDDIQGAY